MNFRGSRIFKTYVEVKGKFLSKKKKKKTNAILRFKSYGFEKAKREPKSIFEMTFNHIITNILFRIFKLSNWIIFITDYLLLSLSLFRYDIYDIVTYIIFCCFELINFLMEN